MSIIRVRAFGGLLPLLPERYLPPEAATTADNLDPKSPEFRPVLGNTTYAAALTDSYPGTIYKFARTSAGAYTEDPSTGWQSSTTPVIVAKQPVDDDASERTTVAYQDGSTAPVVIDNTGGSRQLGVPTPSQPTVVINSGSYFTAAERDTEISKARANVVAALATALARAKVGATYTNNTSDGYLEDGSEVSDPPSTKRWRVYRYSAFEGSISNAYVGGVTAADVAWVRATRAGEWKQSTGTPAWMGAAGTWHYAVPYNAYGAGWKFTSGTASTALTALKLPDGVTALLDAAQVTEICAKVADIFDPAGELANPVVQPLKDAVTKLESALNARPQGSYTSAETTTEITAAKTACANAIYDKLYRSTGTTTTPYV